MKKRFTGLFLSVIMTCVLVACGRDSSHNETKEDSNETEVVEEENEINENILAIAETDEQFNTYDLIELANKRMKMDPEFYAGSKVPKIDSCVAGIVYDEVNSGDGTYVYYFGEGEEAKDTEVYLSAVLAYSAHLRALGLTYELNKDEMCYIYDGSDAVASFMVFNTTEDGFVMCISPQ